MRYYFYFLALLFLASCSSEDVEVPGEQLSVYCDGETVDGDEFVTNGDKFKGAQFRSSDKSRSGKYSVKLNKDQPFGFTYAVEKVKKGDIIKASVWKHKDASSGGLVISGETEEDQYEFNFLYKKEEAEWGQIELFFVAQKDYERIVVYALNGDASPAYFDDMKIEGFFNNSLPGDTHPALEINIDYSSYNTLSNFRDVALKQGVITSDLKEYIDAKMTIDGKKVPIELRLKGDWTDHLETNKWSFRIKIGGDNAYRGMKTFSIQNPTTRSFMLEWFAHKMYEREDILTTRYIFVPVIINGEKKGVYALEEHFDKQLLEYRKRREGPIVKFDESGIWQLHYVEKNEHKHYDVPGLESAEVMPFKKNRTYKSPTLTKQFKVAKGQMERYRNHDPEVDEYFDIESLAKFIALSDVLNGKHGSIWHNQRNYFNPVTNKLEPIAYDCFMEPHLISTKVDLKGLDRKRKKNFSLIEAALSNKEVEEKYFEYLKLYSNDKFLNEAFKEMSKEIADAEKLLNYEYPNIKLDKEFFKNNCKQVREQLPEYAEHRKNPNSESQEAKTFEELPEGVIFTDMALKTNIENIYEDGSVIVSLRNFHSADLEIIGYSIKANKDSLIPLPKKTLKAFVSKPVVSTLRFKEKPRRIHYRAKNCGDEVFKAKPNKWGITVEPAYIGTREYPSFPANENGEVILKGTITLSQDLFIPKGNVVIIEAGTQIKLRNNAAIVSHSPVDVRGAKDSRVTISSPDGTANGFTVLSDEKSKMSYATFDNMNTMNKSNWALTGAVTFYGGNVEIDNCQFLNNNCEDGLNLIRCEFIVSNSEVRNTFSDGFDADFCTGELSSSHFESTGNDCIDFSGSVINIKDCTIKNSGDKGISGGEGSNLTVSNCSIDGAHIAIASKDLSKVKVSKVSMINCQYGFSAYRKKPEYGPATITVDSMTKMGAKSLHLLEKGSKLIYMDKEYVGKRKFDIDSMYMAYQK